MSQQHYDLTRALVQQLESLRAAGVRELPRVEIAASDMTSAQTNRSMPAPTSTEENLMTTPQNADDVAGASELASGGDQAGQLQVLQDQVAACQLCSELASTRTQTVFGVGNPDARVVFFGEAPGADEDRQGEPFVGRAGQLLTKIIAACTWGRDDVYILNTLKCRPPGNRNPDAEELSNCRPFWQKQLEIIQPEYIVCLGKFAMQELLSTPPSQSIGRMRHKFHTFGDAKVVVTYHPSYLLRTRPPRRTCGMT